MYRRPRRSGLGLLAANLALLITHAVAAQEVETCRQLNTVADAGFDFTEELSRWGGKESRLTEQLPQHVRSITINPLPIFNETNPEEDRWLYRLANDLHFTTRQDVIADQLLFLQDQPVTEQMLEESERILRSRQYVGDARIRVLQDCTDAVDLEVVTHEVWTLTPDFRYKNTGGHSSFGVGVKDANFLGSGQLVDLHYRNNQERSTVGLTYKNANVLGTHGMLETDFSNNSDGHRHLLETGLPFYSLRDKWSWNLRYESVEEILNQYQYGERVSNLLHQGDSAAITLGYAPDTSGYTINRFSAGLAYEDQTLQAGPGLPVPAAYRSDLQLVYPFVQYELLQDAYEQGYNINQIQRTEDLYVGRHLITSLGYAPGNAKQWIVKGEYSDTLYRASTALLQLHSDWEGRWQQQTGQWEDAGMHASLNYHRGQSAKRTLFLSLEAAKVLNLRNGRQLELGGSNGLRGYDTHFLNGNGSIRFTAEQRLFTNHHFLQLFRLGVAAYYDAGKVFGTTGTESGTTFQDVGLGLRLAPSRSQSGQIIHLDVVYPLDSLLPGGKHELQFIAEVKKAF